MEYKGFYIWMGFDDPMYTDNVAFIVSEFSQGRKGPNGEWGKTYIESPLFNYSLYSSIDEEKCMEVMKKYIDYYLINNKTTDINAKYFNTIKLDNSFLDEIKPYMILK